MAPRGNIAPNRNPARKYLLLMLMAMSDIPLFQLPWCSGVGRRTAPGIDGIITLIYTADLTGLNRL